MAAARRSSRPGQLVGFFIAARSAERYRPLTCERGRRLPRMRISAGWFVGVVGRVSRGQCRRLPPARHLPQSVNPAESVVHQAELGAIVARVAAAGLASTGSCGFARRQVRDRFRGDQQPLAEIHHLRTQADGTGKR
jgi:hypothetical protein